MKHVGRYLPTGPWRQREVKKSCMVDVLTPETLWGPRQDLLLWTGGHQGRRAISGLLGPRTLGLPYSVRPAGAHTVWEAGTLGCGHTGLF